MRLSPRFLVPAAALTLLAAAARPARAQVAVVVNLSNPLTAVSVEALRALFLGQTTGFANRQRVLLVEDPAVREAFDRRVLLMDVERVKRHWIGLVFAGDGAVPPRAFEDPVALKQFVAQHAGAIGLLDFRAVDGSVKVLRIDRLYPSDSGYPIRAVVPGKQPS